MEGVVTGEGLCGSPGGATVPLEQAQRLLAAHLVRVWPAVIVESPTDVPAAGGVATELPATTRPACCR